MKSTKATAHTPKELLAEMKGLIAEAQTMAADTVSEYSAEALDALRARFADVRERFADLYAGARKRIVAGAKHTDATVRANPYESMAVALGVGMVLAIVIGRRSR